MIEPELSITSHHTGVLAFVGWMCDQLGITALFDDMLIWDEKRCKLPPSARLKALLMAIIYDRTALYRVDEFFEVEDTAVLFGRITLPEDFTDDALARALDKLSGTGGAKVFTTACAKALATLGVTWEELQIVHFDTTSVSVYGEYAGRPDGPLSIVRGFSKDGHPELKQFQFGLLASPEGLPYFGLVLDGNASDNQTNTLILRHLQKNLPLEKLKKMLYVADSKLITEDNLDLMHEMKISFVSRLPETFSAATAAKETAWQNGVWTVVGRLGQKPTSTSYEVQEVKVWIYGREYRAVVVRSDSLEKRKKKSVDKKVETERQGLEKQLKNLSSDGFACQADAKKVLHKLQGKAHFWQLQWEVRPLTRLVPLKKPGRPPKDQPRSTETVYVVQGETILNEQAVLEAYRRESTFVLVSKNNTLDATGLLREYKNQQTANEIPFHNIKAMPVAPVFFKKPSRVEAFAWLALIAYLVYASTQYVARKILAQERDLLIVPGKRKVAAPTARSIFDMLDRIQTVRLSEDGGNTWTRHVACSSQETRKLLYLLHVPMSIYTTGPSGYESPKKLPG